SACLTDVPRRFRAEHAAPAVRSRTRALLCDHHLHRWPGCVAFEPAGLPVEPLQGGELLYVPELCLANGGFEHANGLVIDLERHRKRLAVLAAMRKRKARRIAEPIW